MTDLDADDCLTKLNTQLNKSMVLMDTSVENDVQPKSNRSIKINTKVQPGNAFNVSPVSRKSILKRTDSKNNEKQNRIETENTENNKETINHDRTSTNTSTVPRPHTIDDLIQAENLIPETTDSTFSLDDILDNEDVWIMDIPRTIDPQELKGQTLVFGDKTKFKIKEERYYAVNHNVKCNITCVLNTGKMKSRYKTINVKPAGTITVRRKLSGISKTKPMQIEDSSVPFPTNLKTRHPLFGVSYEGKVRKCAIK
ncbi:uncharacterized protein LOC128890880 isoform X1 [Hylaeus anthracinus]|uniref:uncharacterized protein LOC128890880 isoform X1 n=2 Tax=Hylaeus anthracinus TaxID=313031 RepID=UPI0023B8E9DA|nr:uncharacterized protein LOC128890880 isoform X1 [Hylaeus anthracinus]